MRRLWHGVRRPHLRFFAKLPFLWQHKRTNQPEILLTIMGKIDKIALVLGCTDMRAGTAFTMVPSVENEGKFLGAQTISSSAR